uniref:Ferredoxin reductase n=1 Tax=uncultured bacterium F25-01 TaxID=1191433 RepID=I3VIE9_9BACT|nr:ferredoxin reductase [uncultured bacterium F25-01]
METYRYLIVGGGMTAAAAIRGIREVDPTGSIGVIGEEADPPYNRPPLSKGLWKGTPLAKVWRKVDQPAVGLHLSRRVDSIDLSSKQATDDRGMIYAFDKCLLATGSRVRKLPVGGSDVIYYRTLADYRRLRGLSESGNRFLVIGGGFIAAEIAAALAMNGKAVSLVLRGDIIGGKIYPRELGLFLNDYYRQKGVTILTKASVLAIAGSIGSYSVTISQQDSPKRENLQVDGIFAGLGVEPNVDLAGSAGLAVEDGVVVDERLRTSHPDVWAAGDVAAFYNPDLDRRWRVEHEDNANTMGRHAGRSMAGKAEPYHHQPFFYSDLFELGYEAVGELDARLETVADWIEPFQRGVVYYLREGRVRGVLLWNVFKQVDAARRLIAEGGPFRAADLRGRIGDVA